MPTIHNLMISGIVLLLFIGLYLLFAQICKQGMIAYIIAHSIVKPFWFTILFPLTLSFLNLTFFHSKLLSIIWATVPIVCIFCLYLFKIINEQKIVMQSNSLRKFLISSIEDASSVVPDLTDWVIWVYPNKKYHMIYCKYPTGSLESILLDESTLDRLINSYYPKTKIEVRISSLVHN